MTYEIRKDSRIKLFDLLLPFGAMQNTVNLIMRIPVLMNNIIRVSQCNKNQMLEKMSYLEELICEL